MPPDSTIIDKTADSLGIDSLIAVEMRSWLLKELGVDLPLLTIIGGNSMRQVLEACRARIDVALMPLLRESERRTATHTAPPSHKDGKAQAPSVQQTLFTSANASRIPPRAAPERHNAHATESISPTHIPTTVQEHSSNQLPPAPNANPDTEAIGLVPDSLRTEQWTEHKTEQESPKPSTNNHNALHRRDSRISTCNNIDGRTTHPIDTKRSAIGVQSVSDSSSSSLSGFQDSKKSSGLLGRLLRSRRLARVRRYLYPGV
jgi:hypothetical protein